MTLSTVTGSVLSAGHHLVESATVGHVIGGSLDSAATAFGQVMNPATAEVLCPWPVGDADTVDRAVAVARAALPGWRATPAAERARALLAMADILEQNSESLAQVESLNVGKPLMVSREELPVAVDALRFMAGAARTAQAPASGEYVRGQLSVVRREPVGVVGAITPWNYPLMMAVWKIAPALAAGNTMVLKPSDLTPISTVLFAQMVADVLPPGVLNIVLGTGEVVGEALTRHPGIAMVSLTGSVASGRSVASSATGTLKRLHLELGGKAPVVVFDDADLDTAVETVKTMGYWNTGQECGSATRVLVHHSMQDAFVDALVAAVATLHVGDPAEGEHVEVGPLISARQLGTVSDVVEHARSEGAVVAVGGRGGRGAGGVDRSDAAEAGAGHFYQPTVVTDVAAGSRMAREEIFGPVVSVQSFRDEAEAVTMANDVDYGLAASVWTRDGARGMRMSGALEFGTVWVNSHLTLASEMPWGGFALSGYGRDMSTYALEDYTRTKHVMIATDGGASSE